MQRDCAIQTCHRRGYPGWTGGVQHHQESLADMVAFVSTLPKSGPFPQGKAGTGGTASHGLLHTEVDFDDTGGALVSLAMPDGRDLAHKDDAGKIGHLVERILEGLWDGWILSPEGGGVDD
jgi:hypothetical protein